MEQSTSITPTARWFYAFEDGWQAFNDEDDGKLEQRWKTLREQGKLKSRQNDGQGDVRDDEQGEGKEEEKRSALSWPPSGVDSIRSALFGTDKSGEEAKKSIENAREKAKPKEAGTQKKGDDGRKIAGFHLDPDESAEERATKVEVMEDHLFDVDLESMELFPVFWKGVLLRVVRAYWFYMSSDGGFAPIPYDEGLSSDLDNAYNATQPWNKTEEAEGQNNNGAIADGEEQDAQTAATDDSCALPSMSNNGRVRFEGPWEGRIFTQDLSGKMLSVLGGSLVIRGWDETARRSKQLRNTSIFSVSVLPWAGGQEPKEDEIDDKEGEEGQDNDRRGSGRARRREGAAKVPHHPRQTKDKGEDDAEQAGEEGRGWLGRLWPGSDSILKPRVDFLRAIGWNKQDAVEEGQRSGRQKNTEEGLRNEKQDQGDAPTEGDDGGDRSEDDGEVETFPDDKKDEPPELVLAIHGIGQKLTDDFDAIDFVYDIERLRNLTKKCANDPTIRRISRGKRAQFLPICWRKELSFDDQEALNGNDNVYGLKDVSNDATIPMVRTIISKVILDVPYYLSRHKKTMMDAVIAELNRVYRLFVRRNPDFEQRGGRVSLICHSLGSALAADILSNQPTQVPPLVDRSKEELRGNDHLVFNVRNLIFVGSPNGFFFHLHGAQLIARRGTARTKDVEQDAARDEQGRYGCMAAEAVYNCYNATDPVAFQLSATVDREYARMLRPISIPDAVPALMDALAEPRLSLSKYFEAARPFTADKETGGEGAAALHPGATVNDGRTSGTHSPLPDARRTKRSTTVDEIGRPVLVEQGSQQKVHQISAKMKGPTDKVSSSTLGKFDLNRLQRAERRFRALNPHGCIDFIYDSGGMNQYLDMLSAHVSYWTSKSFATFVLTQLFSDFTHPDDVPTVVPRLVTEPGPQGDDDGDVDSQKDVCD